MLKNPYGYVNFMTCSVFFEKHLISYLPLTELNIFFRFWWSSYNVKKIDFIQFSSGQCTEKLKWTPFIFYSVQQVWILTWWSPSCHCWALTYLVESLLPLEGLDWVESLMLVVGWTWLHPPSSWSWNWLCSSSSSSSTFLCSFYFFLLFWPFSAVFLPREQ